MSTPVNLNRARKDRARVEARQKADANVAKFGRTKAERAAQKAADGKTRRTVDAHNIEK